MSGYILLVGAVFKEEAVEATLALAASGNYWRRGLYRGLVQNDCEIKVLGHRGEQAWPKGNLFPNEVDFLDPEFDSTLVKWMNLPGVRYPLLGQRFITTLRQMIRSYGKPSVILTYNPYPWHLPVARYAQEKHSIPWVSVTLDYDYVEAGWDRYLKDAGDAAGHVFLSHWAYTECPCVAPKLHMDGGFDEWLGDEIFNVEPNAKKVCLYSGKYADYGGYQLLLEMVRELKGADVEFWFTGKVPEAKRKELESLGDHVRILGFVDEQKLHELSLRADVFLNPRPSHLIENKVAFPSKIVRYLAYGKPIVSTWTPGISPEYRDYLFVPDREDGQSFAEMIRKVLAFTPSDKDELKRKIRGFIERDKSWTVQAGRLKNWLEAESLIQK